MAWSLSQYGTYQKCPLQYELRYKKRLPAPTSFAAARGTDTHAILEGYLQTGEWTSSLSPFAITKAEAMRARSFAPEVKLSFDREWMLVPWDSPTVWLRGVVDAMRIELPRVEMGEWKTGKEWEDHKTQRELYNIMALSANPDAEQSYIETIYVDGGYSVFDTLERAMLPFVQREWSEKVAPMEADTFFSPRPGPYCRFCPYNKQKGGPCEY